MKKFRDIFYIFLLLPVIFIFFSCECVPTIDSEKTILPTQFGKVCFINATDKFDYVNIYQRELYVADSLCSLYYTNQDITTTKPEKIETGLTNIKIFDSKIYKAHDSNKENNTGYISPSPILSFISEIELDKYYSAVFYTQNNLTKCLFMQDSIGLLQNTKSSSILRLVNLSPNKTIFELDKKTELELSPFASSELILYNFDEIINICVYDSNKNTILSTLIIQTEKNNFYNIFYLQDISKIKVSKYTYS